MKTIKGIIKEYFELLGKLAYVFIAVFVMLIGVGVWYYIESSKKMTILKAEMEQIQAERKQIEATIEYNRIIRENQARNRMNNYFEARPFEIENPFSLSMEIIENNQ